MNQQELKGDRNKQLNGLSMTIQCIKYHTSKLNEVSKRTSLKS